FSLLASSAQGSLNVAISELGGLSALITYDRAEELALGISMEIEREAQTQSYSLRIQPRGRHTSSSKRRCTSKTPNTLAPANTILANFIPASIAGRGG
ncbi:MAG: hypothetical protein ABSF54_21580, partial [Bryobacteraceae bacterium]